MSSKEAAAIAKSATGVVSESVIRKMTRLAQEYSAVNLSQGFPNEAPPIEVRLALAHAVLTGQPASASVNNMNENGSGDIRQDVHYQSLLRSLSFMSSSASSSSSSPLSPAVTNANTSKNSAATTNSINGNSQQQQQRHQSDILNQYSPPMGREDVRNAIAAYYQRFYNYKVDIGNITVTLGATEALASAVRCLSQPNDKAVIFEPFHELYPSQCQLFYVKPEYVTLRPCVDNNDKKTWVFDQQELEVALKDPKVKMLLLNTPHNPTGKIFTRAELKFIVDLCLQYQVYIVTDEIYEFMCNDYSGDSGNNDNTNDNRQPHILIPKEFPEIAHLCLVCNSIGKSASATGWRLGWCLHPPQLSEIYRGIHDQLAVMSPHPVQYAALTYLALPDKYFLKDLKERYKTRIDTLASTLTDLGFGVLLPEGAYYLFVKYRGVPALSKFDTPMQAAMYLMEKVGVACVPGDNFYGKAVKEEGNQYLRFAACRSKEDIAEACLRLRKHLTTKAVSNSTTKTKNICLFGTSANPPTGREGHIGIVQALSGMKRDNNDNNALLFDEIQVVPVYSHPFAAKRALLAPFHHRVQMCELAFQTIPNVTVSKAEETIYHVKIQKKQALGEVVEGISVGTADLLEHYQQSNNDTANEEQAPAQYTLCLGMDTFLDLMTGKWRRTQDILDLVQGRFVVLYRKEGDDNDGSDDEMASQTLRLKEAMYTLEESYGASDACLVLHVPTLGAISSTLVRSLSSELSLKSMVGGTMEPQNMSDLTQLPLKKSHSDLAQLEERMKKMVSPDVFDYMQKHQLYGVDGKNNDW